MEEAPVQISPRGETNQDDNTISSPAGEDQAVFEINPEDEDRPIPIDVTAIILSELTNADRVVVKYVKPDGDEVKQVSAHGTLCRRSIMYRTN